jgi:putative redox protein
MTINRTEIIASWKGEMAFIGENVSGGTVQIGTFDGKPGVGPMQLLLFGLAGCTGMDIISILGKKRIIIEDMKIKVSATRASDFPMIWTDIHVIYLLWGFNINPKDLEQAIHLSEEKYCSVGIMLGKSSSITSEYKILKPGEILD